MTYIHTGQIEQSKKHKYSNSLKIHFIENLTRELHLNKNAEKFFFINYVQPHGYVVTGIKVNYYKSLTTTRKYLTFGQKL